VTDTKSSGLVVLCQPDGAIRQVLGNNFPEIGTLEPGDSFFDWVDIGSREKLRNLLAEVHLANSAYDWELNVSAHGQLTTLHFSGVAKDGNMIIIAAKNRSDIFKIYDELMRINNEYVNALRAAIKEQIQLAKELDQRDSSIYDQLSRLNNELSVLQRELTKKNFELERLNQLKNQFLGMAAHDLRSPLSAIMTYSEFLAQETAPLLNAEQKEFLEIINTSSQFMRGLIEDLLDVSAIEAGQLSLYLQTTQLETLLSRTVKLHQALAGQQHKISLTCASQLPPANLDRAKIEQVINNLISNAVKYSPTGSEIHIHLQQAGQTLLLTVQDHGQGIAAEEMNKLFKVFSKASSRTTTGEKSTGLGLAIVYKIIQGHQGKIWAESTLSQGTTFYVTLPCIEVKEPAE